ncbi:hypothetical protein ACKX1U_13025, partial [Staphylococcus haemolyticus]
IMDAKKAIDGHGEPWESIVEDKEARKIFEVERL